MARCVCMCVCVSWGGGGVGEKKHCEICDMDQRIKLCILPPTKTDSMQLSNRYSPGTSNFSNDIAWNHAFCQNRS